jgi:hypothetical protein
MLQDRFDVRAVCCGVAKKAEPFANEFQADVVDGYRAMVSRNDIDAVMILERSWQGWLPVLAACDAGQGGLLGGRSAIRSDRRCRLFTSGSTSRGSRLWRNCRAICPRDPAIKRADRDETWCPALDLLPSPLSVTHPSPVGFATAIRWPKAAANWSS